jgi:CRISPR-associated protein Csb2
MSTLTAHVRFIAHSYSGVRIGPDRREILDWPPSPARLHEALLSAALTGLPRNRAEEAEVWKAFEWLEALPPPVILAPAHDEEARSRPRRAIPQNNPAGTSKLHTHSTLLAPTLKAVPPTDAPLEVFYCWELDDENIDAGQTPRVPCRFFDILADAAARVS